MSSPWSSSTSEFRSSSVTAILVRSSGAFSPALRGASARPRRTRIFILAWYFVPNPAYRIEIANTAAETHTKTRRRRNSTTASSRVVGAGLSIRERFVSPSSMMICNSSKLLTSPAGSDLLPVVDIDDTTMAYSGTRRRSGGEPAVLRGGIPIAPSGDTSGATDSAAIVAAWLIRTRLS